MTITSNLPDAYQQALASFHEGRLEDALSMSERLRDRLSQDLSGLSPQQWQQYQRLLNLQQKTLELAISCFHALGQNDEAIAYSHKLLRLNPDNPEAHCKLAYYLLYAGEFAAGWEEFEWRHRMPSRRIPYLETKNRWQGENLPGETLLVLCQQGFGDAIQFARYLPMARERVGRLVFHCRRPLAPLFEGVPYIDELMVEVIRHDTPIDAYTNICSLAKIFAADPTNVPPPLTLREPPNALKRRWQSRLTREGFNIGIAWSGSSMRDDDASRPGRLEDFQRLLGIPGVHLYSLQLHERIDALPENFHQLGTEIGDFADTAAIIGQLDLVISVDTALAHLALTMRRETWVVLPMVTDWRWVGYAVDGSSGRCPDSDRGCIWYPEARMFKQRTRCDRHDVMERVVRALHERMTG